VIFLLFLRQVQPTLDTIPTAMHLRQKLRRNAAGKWGKIHSPRREEH